MLEEAGANDYGVLVTIPKGLKGCNPLADETRPTVATLLGAVSMIIAFFTDTRRAST